MPAEGNTVSKVNTNGTTRRADSEFGLINLAFADNTTHSNSTHIEEFKELECSVEDVDSLVVGIHSFDLMRLSKCTRVLAGILKESKFAVDKCMTLTAVPDVVKLLRMDSRSPIPSQAAWALANLMDGSSAQVDCVVEARACPILIRLLESDKEHMAMTAVWALMHVAGAGPTFRDMLVEQGIVPPLTRLVKRYMREPLLNAMLCCLTNLASYPFNEPRYAGDVFKTCLLALRQLLAHRSESVIQNACCLFAHIAEELIYLDPGILKSYLLNRLISIVQTSEKAQIVESALVSLQKISKLDPQLVVEHGALRSMKYLFSDDSMLTHIDPTVAIGVLQHIVNESNIRSQLVAQEGLVSLIGKLLQHESVKVRSHAMTLILEVLACATENQMNSFVIRKGMIIPSLVQLLSFTDDTYLLGGALMTLLCFVNAAKSALEPDNIWKFLDNLKFSDRLERLRKNESDDDEIRFMAELLLNKRRIAMQDNCAHACNNLCREIFGDE